MLGGSQILALHLVQVMAYFVIVPVRHGQVFFELDKKPYGWFSILNPLFFLGRFLMCWLSLFRCWWFHTTVLNSKF